MKDFELGSNEWLYQMYLKKGDKVYFTNMQGLAKVGIVLNNYNNGELRVEYLDGIREEIIGVEQILSTEAKKRDE